MDETNIVFSSKWFLNTPPEEVDALKAQLIGDKKTLDKLKKMLYNMVESDRDVRYSDYDNPSWSHKEAHRHGRLEAFCEIIKIITLDKKDETL